ncbi:Flp pilus assembly protein CpaB [Bacillus sp. T3]|uniref:Flp pilus assembly protein CpaB n=1 Tax=Bacillus sp. T3 TaxID=467262 RepID=UPI0029826223|nr:Flp pilus assembly protein CpaB [Bacillus sp. T3]
MNTKKIWMLSMIIASIFTITFYFYLSSGVNRKEQTASTQANNVASAKKEKTTGENATQSAKTKEMLKISPNKRAISIAVDHVKGVSGLIRPGNIVDVIAYIPENAEGVSKTEILLQEIKVLAVGSKTTADIDPTVELTYPSVTVEVTPEQAIAVATVSVKGSLTFMLRKTPDQESSKAKTNTKSQKGEMTNAN